MRHQHFRQLLMTFSVLFLLIMVGTLWLTFVENASLINSIYMSVITLTTVGFGEIIPLSDISKVFMTCYILAGVGTLGYLFTRVATFIVEGDLSRVLRGRKMEKVISRLNQHVIVCGFGKVGSSVAEILKNNNETVVVIEQSLQEELENYIHISGDATEDRILEEAGVSKAKAVVTCLSSDADNVFVTLSVRTVNKNVRIIARAISKESIKKLKSAGADEVVSIHDISARRMANTVIRPNIINMVDFFSTGTEVFFEVSEIDVEKNPNIANKTIIELNVKRNTGALIIAVRKENQSIVFNPDASYLIEKSDTLIVMGKSDQIKRIYDFYK